ncbi:MAG: hypothetical protein OEW90_04980, partial [Betaproteobacteria bacterium]|nr:hypothetical protein [Betaproteobacteria bacterium]
MIPVERQLKYRDEVMHFAPPPPARQDELRRQVELCDQLMAKLPDPGAFHLEHYFARGVYGRAIFIPKD